MELLNLSERKLIILLQGCEHSRRDQLLLQEELSEQNRDLRETRIKSLHEMEEILREFKNYESLNFREED